jgi:hypothetical protein
MKCTNVSQNCGGSFYMYDTPMYVSFLTCSYYVAPAKLWTLFGRNVIMKYKANVTIQPSNFLESAECTNCITAQDMKFLILLPPFCLFGKYVARQEELPQIYVHFVTIMAFLFSGYPRLCLLVGNADDWSPSRSKVTMRWAVPSHLHIIP